MIYFDAAATTLQKPPQVRKMAAYAMEHYASPGRGGYRAAMLASDAVYDCRKELAELLNLPPRPVYGAAAAHGRPGRAPPHRQAVRPAAPEKAP